MTAPDYEATQASAFAHENIHTAVRVLMRRRPFTRELDALVTLLNGICERHRVSLDSGWDPKCSCGTLLGDDEVCPDMGAVQYLVDAIIEDDQSEVIDRSAAVRARAKSLSSGA
ncbi:hypothetical protein GCM10010182_67190 [Actinomadura cremea]|nr:hypothetical protein GCM10010182_67190 [Actinomadura cremea]